MVNEFIRERFAGKIAQHSMNKLQVYKETITQIIKCEQLGKDMSEERSLLQELLQNTPDFVQKMMQFHEFTVKAKMLKGP